MRRVLLLSFLALPATLCVAAPAAARDSLGIFESWGAFVDSAVPRCYAIAQPVQRGRRAGWQPFAAVANWPGASVRGQLHIRLSQSRRAQAAVTLSIGDRRFALVAGDADAWAPDRQTDAAIIAAMRSAPSMSIATLDPAGRAFADIYALRGAATAIDAAAVGCSRR